VKSGLDSLETRDEEFEEVEGDEIVEAAGVGACTASGSDARV